MTAIDRMFMKKALGLARKAEGRTSPNPLVGALVVRGDRVLGQGYHQIAGGPHAEVEALADAGGKARGATLYVTMEPCPHWGRTGPCTDAILSGGIRRVVAGAIDPNPLVSGRGLRILKKAGVSVTARVLEDECRLLNESYEKFITTRRPFVVMKAAISMDGCLATARGESRWISGEASREFAHRLRERSDAILVGIGTVLADDPRLTARPRGRSEKAPYRVIVDSSLRIPTGARILRQEPWATIIATTARAPRAKKEALLALGTHVLILPSRKGRVSLPALLKELGKMNIVEVLAEGGAGIFAELLSERLVDKAHIIVAPMFLGKGIPVLRGWSARRLADARVLRVVSARLSGQDTIITGYMRN